MRPSDPADVPTRLMRSAASPDSPVTPTARVLPWLAERAAAGATEVSRIPFSALCGWRVEPGTENLVHHTGRFFSVEGLRVRTGEEGRPEWAQPIVVQPEVGLLGMLVKEVGGVLHCLVHAKMEPGLASGVQLSPTVQATRSNYTGVHGGRATRYLEYFRPSRRSRVLVDVAQSEQGSWFLHKRNRNVVVEVREEVPAHDDYCWLTLGQLAALLHRQDTVNMDTRSVLSCIRAALPAPPPRGDRWGRGTFGDAVLRSFGAGARTGHAPRQAMAWLAGQRARRTITQRRVPLAALAPEGWHRSADEIAHGSGRYFRVIAVEVRTGSREVAQWSQPLLAPAAPGLLALLARRVAGVLHVLVHARLQAGSRQGPELAPTVHCQPADYRGVPPCAHPPYLAYVLAADPARVRYDVVQSEEGGRLFHARNRYVVLEVEDDFPLDAPHEYRWMTLGQLAALLARGGRVNVELRTLVACTRALA